MQNKLLPSYHRRQVRTPDTEEPIEWDHRLAMIFGIFAVCFVAIAIRLAWIQTTLRDEYIDGFDRTRVEYEVIPGRDGRVLTDETVLAADVVRYDIEAHYRWLESPADAGWLTQKARQEIPAGKRRTAERLEAAKYTVQQRRSQMWRRLSQVAGVDAAELVGTLSRVQSRVEKIAESVNRRHQERESAAASPTTESGLAGMLEQAKREITSPPKRRSLAPIVVQEELAYHAIASNVSLEVAAEIRAHPELYPGLQVREATTRMYPQKTLAAHLVGTRSRDGDSDDPHRVGRSGIERSYDGRLRGIDGQRKVTFNRRGEVIGSEIVRQPISGRDVVLTIESSLQRSAELLLDQALKGAASVEAAGSPTAAAVPPGGCILVLDAHSGDVLTIANGPRFDVNEMVRPTSGTWNATMNDPRHPLFPRATQMTVPPGSVFKVLTAAAMLEGSNIDSLEHQFCRGYLDRPDRHRCYIFRHYGTGHGKVTLRSALAQSCNVYFFQTARSMGIDPLVDWADRFGFGQPTGIDLPFERRGNVPKPKAATPGSSGSKWYKGDTLGLAIGQSRLTVTPLQVARMMAAIANGGYLVTPRVADETRATQTDNSYAWSPKPRRRIHGLSEESIAEIRHGLFSAVNDPGGTGYKTVRLDEISIAGKTGTAETGGGRPDHAWFAGYVPANRPRFAFVVVLEHGGSGGRVAGPVARELVKAMIEHGLLNARQMKQEVSLTP